MKELCSCCEGIEQITPVSNVNRPGLSALAYRVGTHATFLETMLARLSTHYLKEAGVDPAAEQQEHSHPLGGLTTRDPQDASIAFLDAWATVADVLTFYQERVANEGYLRTATERRSVLELARLLGYQPRPGVSASVHLAYTLEDGKEVTIPAGSRAQSVPGPGELPQSFETAEDSYARAEWNLLQPRLQRPQAVRPQELIQEKPLYLKGTATNLKLNDPVLIDFGQGSVSFFRVVEVEPEQAADRTKVTLRHWLLTSKAAPRRAPVSTSGTVPSAILAEQQSEAVRQIILRYSNVEEFGVNAATQMAQQVLAQLQDLKNKLKSGISWTELRDVLSESLLPLREKHRQAREANFTKLEPWIGSIVSDLEEVRQKVLAEIAKQGSTTGQQSASAQPAATQPALVYLAPLLESLEKPASLQPASRQQLGTGLADTLSPASDALPQLLVALNPSLRPLLYGAWESVSNPANGPTPARIYALRTRAAVFGNNAPLKPVLDDRGRVEDHEEWTLFTETGKGPTERFTIGISFSLSGGEFPEPLITTTIDITPPSPPAHGTATRSLSNQTFPPINLPTANNETVTVVLSNITPNVPLQLTATFNFQVRGITVTAERNREGRWMVRTEGCDPTAVTINRVTGTQSGMGDAVTIEGELEIGAGQGPTEESKKVSLDASYNQILPGSWAVLERPSPLKGGASPLVITQVERVTEVSRANYGMTAKGTRLELSDEWIAPNGGDDFRVIRGTTVFTQSELLELAEEPIDPIEEALCGDRIELANLVSGLEPGRWLIVSGERTDVQPTRTGTRTNLLIRDQKNVLNVSGEMRDFGTAKISGAGEAVGAVKAGEPNSATDIVPGLSVAELVMLSGVEQGFDARVSGDKTHTTLLLAEPLAYCYKLDTVRVYGNVVPATHGETRSEVLGSGDASKAMQSFTLAQQPLTYISAPTPNGIESTLQVRVSDILWHETDSLAGLGPKDHKYVTKTDDESKTTVIFGNGREGARLSTDAENVKAQYRTGIGRPGNVKADQISMVITKPLGVKEVINPLAATGGADRESRDEMRRNAPLAVMSLDRLVSTQDYEDFARTFAGVGKASAARLSDGRRQVVHLSIAGADDIPISPTSDLFRNLGEALRKYGDPYQPIQIATRFLKVLVASARVRVHPDHLWEVVEPKVRAAVLEHFSFNRRQLGQDVVLSELIGAIQSVEGVLYVDVDTLDAVEENISTTALLKLSGQLRLNQRIRVHLAQVDKTALDPSVRLRPAQLALFTPLVPETLNLTELKG